MQTIPIRSWLILAVTLAATSAAASSASDAADTDSAMSAFLADATTTRDFDDISLESLLKVNVVTASRHEQQMAEAPSSVTIITSQEIAAHGYETLAEALGGLAGLYVFNDHSYEYVGVRGFCAPGDYNTRVLLLVDGHAMNDNVWAMPGIGTDGPVDLDLVDRIEVVRGPGSALYGTSAILAVVQVITKKPGERPGPNGAVQYGTNDLRCLRVGWSGRLPGRTDFLVSVGGLRTDGAALRFPVFAEEEGGGIAEKTDFDRFNREFVSLRSGRFSARFLRYDRTKGIPTAPYGGVFNDRRNTTLDVRSNLDVVYETPVHPKVDLTVRGYLDRAFYKGIWPTEVLADSTDSESSHVVLWEDDSHDTWGGAELRAAWRPADAHHLLGGVEFRRIHLGMRNWIEDPDSAVSEQTLEFEKWSRFHAAYLQEEYSASPNLTFTLGLHYDHYQSWGGNWTPRAAVTFGIAPGTIAKLLIDQGFRAPTLGEIYYEDEYLTIANLDLDPERAKTVEAVLERTWRRGLWSRLAAYHTDVSDMIQFVETDDGYLQYQNGGTVYVNGGELEVRATLPGRIETSGNLAYADAWDHTNDARMVNSPRWTGDAAIVVPFLGDRMTAAFEGRFVGDRKGAHPGAVAESYLIGSAKLSWKTPLEGLKVGLKVYNLGDTEYFDPAGEEHGMDVLPQDGRRWVLSVRYSPSR